MEGAGHQQMGLTVTAGENNSNPVLIGRMIRPEDNDSRSDGSDNLDGASGDDQEVAVVADGQPPRRKKYHRHTPQQIQELETFYQEFPHPDEKQRAELSNKLGLERKQIKFWFQNRRTQMKSRFERHENMLLRGDNERLKAENEMFKQAMASPICSNCGGQAVPGEISIEQHQLKIENARLKDELHRICALANKFLGRPLLSPGNPIPSQGLNSNLELSVGRNGNTLSMGFGVGDGAMSLMGHPADEYDKASFLNVALRAFDELIKLAQMDSPLWTKGLDGGIETLNQEEYRRTFSSFVGVKASGYKTEASRETGMVNLSGLSLVETLMNAIDAELHVLSPMAPIRLVRFLRFCKKHSEGVWAVVDVSIDATPEAAANSHWSPNCRRLPSGCLIQDIDNKYSKVTWVEHSEYDGNAVNHLLRPLISSGFGFGAPRWIATLQRQSERLAVLTASPDIPDEDNAGITLAGRRSMLKLGQRMTSTFCSGVCASSLHKWDGLIVGGVGEEVRVLTRKIMHDPGEPRGVMLSASTSEWLPVTQQRLFDFLRDERMRSQWDVLFNGGPIHLMVNIPKGTGYGNCVSLLGNNINGNENNMLIFQESWCDASGAIVVYAPVDLASMSAVMKGGDSACVALLPSGFAILPGITPSFHGGGQSDSIDVDGSGSGGCILTIALQILVNSVPTAKLTTESIQTVSNIIACTIQKIKAALTIT